MEQLHKLVGSVAGDAGGGEAQAQPAAESAGNAMEGGAAAPQTLASMASKVRPLVVCTSTWHVARARLAWLALTAALLRTSTHELLSARQGVQRPHVHGVSTALGLCNSAPASSSIPHVGP